MFFCSMLIHYHCVKSKNYTKICSIRHLNVQLIIVNYVFIGIEWMA